MPKPERAARRGQPDGSSLELSISPAVRRGPAFLFIAIALVVLWLGFWWHRAHDHQVRSFALALEPDPLAQPWTQGYLLIPAAPPPATPAEQLDARLSVFARHVEKLREGVDPPLVAFGSESLRDAIEQTIARIDDRAQVSVHIRDLDSGQVLFDYFGDTLLNPASNHKLLTTSAAIDLLGPDYVFETRVLLVGETLYLIGEGDPTIDGEALAVLAHEVAERIPAGSITQIVVDDSAFSPQTLGPGYSTEGWGASYMAPSGALSINFNTVEITVYPVKGSRIPAVRLEPDSAHVIVDNGARMGSGATRLELRSLPQAVRGARVVDDLDREELLTRVEIEGTLARTSRGYKVRRRVVDPGMFAGGAFAQMLASFSQSEVLPVKPGLAPTGDFTSLNEEHGDDEHGEFPRLVAHDKDGGDVILVARRRSPPLIEIVGGLLAYSNNFTAEQLLRTLGWRMTGDPGDWDNGGAVVRGYWEALGNDPGALVFENGSGLSAVGRVTTAGLVDLMAVAARSQSAGSRLIDALPVAGAAGTLRTRLRRSGKRVRAKTGTLDGISGLTGVITTEDGEPQVAFSILINVRESGSMAAALRRKTEDRIVLDVLDHIDGWEAIRGTLILDLPELSVTPG